MKIGLVDVDSHNLRYVLISAITNLTESGNIQGFRFRDGE